MRAPGRGLITEASRQPHSTTETGNRPAPRRPHLQDGARCLKHALKTEKENARRLAPAGVEAIAPCDAMEEDRSTIPFGSILVLTIT